MEHLERIPKYHKRVILLYIVLTPFLIFFWKDYLRYEFWTENLTSAAPIAMGSALMFLWLLYGRTRPRIAWSCSAVIVASAYSLAFAIPEEIIFRGIVQKLLWLYFQNTPSAVFLSATVFGLAHVYNGAKGFGPASWNWKLAGLTFLAGLPLGVTYALTDSLLIPTLLHGFFVFCLKLTEEKS